MQTSYSETMPVAFEGMKGSLKPDKVETAFNEEASAGLLFGKFVKWGTVDTNVPKWSQGVKRLTAIAEAIAGVVLHSHDVEVTTADGGVAPKAPVSLLRQGDCWSICEDAFVKEGFVFVRCVIAGSEVAGAVRASADASDCVKLLSARFLNSGDAGALAHIEFDMLANKGAALAATLP